MLTQIPDEATLRQLQVGLKCAIDISYQFVETGVHAPVITIWDSMSPAQETILDLILAEYLWWRTKIDLKSVTKAVVCWRTDTNGSSRHSSEVITLSTVMASYTIHTLWNSWNPNTQHCIGYDGHKNQPIRDLEWTDPGSTKISGSTLWRSRLNRHWCGHTKSPIHRSNQLHPQWDTVNRYLIHPSIERPRC